MPADAIRLELAHPVPVAVWLVEDLDRAAGTAPAEHGFSPAEWARAQRFRMPLHRMRYLMARRALRCVLGARLALDPSQVALADGPHGKPRLAQGAPPYFNLSHHEALCVIATCELAEVGVDVERVTGKPNVEELAEVSMTAAERDALVRLDAARREQAFLVAWTRKEACLKAIGCGMRIDPVRLHAGIAPETAEIAVDLPPGAHPVLVSSHLLGGGTVLSIATTAAGS